MKTLDQVLIEKIANWYIGEWPIGNFVLCVIALILSAILCGTIGYERERRGMAAGLRTHLLVGFGSCIIMIISIYGFPTIYVDGVQLSRDIARLAAQVITGVGFLGAGAIIHKNDGIRGLTTAATIWISMAIGLACGSMNFILATGGTIIIILILTVFKNVELKITRNSPMISIHSEKDKPIVSKLLEISKNLNCEINDIRYELTNQDLMEITFHVLTKNQFFDVGNYISEIKKIDGIKEVILLNSHRI
ncbi:MAG: MgtC/SapB family protein [Acholeplasmatales bacterium]|nr:MgtC/SapB family protein [Acholeplasmatales bacterium]